jgi:hypothetical protein
MEYTEQTESYNEKRYGKPWMAFVTGSLTKDFAFIDWQGRSPGCAGEFNFTADPGTLIAYGQKDIRKNRGGVDGYQICMPDGSLPIITKWAAELRKMQPEERWREVARRKLAYATTRPTEEYNVPQWEKVCNEMAKRYSAMLGVENPLMRRAAEALGLVEEPKAETETGVDMSAFGL